MMNVAIEITNPFPGLRSYEREQADLFFGRDEQIEELVDRLEDKHFVGVVGVSGSGKSSLVRAGVIPALEQDALFNAEAGWRIVIFRPGQNPLVELARALSRAFANTPEESEAKILGELGGSSAALARFAMQRLGRHEKLLLVVDQFEEVFRYGDAQKKVESATDDPAAFVKLLLAATGQSEHPLPGLEDAPVYVVITMRSDFLGKCSRFRGLPEALNDSQYLVPRLTREQQRDVIEGPIGMAGAAIEPRLVQRLLNDVGDNQDQLPALQHALMRTWEESAADRAAGHAIKVEHYETVGGMTDALDRDADDAFAALAGDPEKEDIARRLFQRLVEPGGRDEETRRPTALSEAVAVAAIPAAAVAAVIEVFQTRGFITVSGGADPIIDITHESLIRNWRRLQQWVELEAEWATDYRWIAADAVRYNRKEGDLLGDLDLQTALAWRDKAEPNEAWARRYHSSFAQAMSFLETSRKTHEDAIELAERQRRSVRRRARATTLVLGSLLLLALGASIIAVLLWTRTRAERDRRSRLFYDANIYFAQHAELEGQFTQARSRLDELLAPGLNELRGFEWFHLWRAAHGEEATLSGHSEPVMSLAFSPDGKTIASASNDKTVKLWDTASRKEVFTLTGHSGAVWSVAFSPDGKILASAGVDKSIKLWDIALRKELVTLTGHSGAVWSVAFSPDGKTLASAGDDKTVKLWDTVSHKELATLSGHSQCVTSVAFSPDSKTLASASQDYTIDLWDVTSHKGLATLEGHSNNVYSVAFSPDGKTLASASNDHTIILWDLVAHKLGATLLGHTDPVWSVAFSPDSKTLASASADRTIKLWDVASGKELDTIVGHSDTVRLVTFSPDGKTLASASLDRTLKLWDINSPKYLKTLSNHSGAVRWVVFSPDGKTLASASDDKTVKLWDTASHQELATFSGHASNVWAVAFSPDGKTLASASSDKTVRLWDIASHQLLATLLGHSDVVWSVVFSPDGKTLASASTDKTIRLWDIASGKELAKLSGHSNAIFLVAFSPDGKTLASASRDWTVKLWDTASHTQLATLADHSESVLSIAFSPDGKTLASGSKDQTIKLWDIGSRQELATLRGHFESVFSVTFSPDGKTLASASADQTVKLWDTASYKELATLEGHLKRVVRVAFSPDGKILASAGEDRTIRLWLAATEGEVEEQRAH